MNTSYFIKNRIERTLVPVFICITLLFYTMQTAKAQDDFFYEYCHPSYASTDEFIASFSTSNAQQNINFSATSSLGENGYHDLTENSTYVIKQNAGMPFDFSCNYIGSNTSLYIWIDWNENGLFDDNERVFTSHQLSSFLSGTIATAFPQETGDYRMRITTNSSWGDSVPCPNNALSQGQTLDFTLSVLPPVACAGVPTLGAISFKNNMYFGR